MSDVSELPYDVSELPDDLIEEILLRLPISTVFRFRRVCKLWRHLTSTPQFIQRWDFHRASLPDPPLGLLCQTSNLRREFLLCSGVPEFIVAGFSLDFLLQFRSNPTIVMTYCNDLLLCCNREEHQKYYCIVNPVTRQWKVLPPVLNLHQNVLIGLVCEPASVARAKISGGLQYRVVRIPIFDESRTEISVEIFSSEDERWFTNVITKAEGLRTSSFKQRGVASNKTVYWKYLRGGVHVMGLNPFNPNEQGITVIQNHVNAEIVRPDMYHLGTCGGSLKYCEMIWNQNTCQIIIWQLKDQAEWEIVSAHPAPAIRELSKTVAFHPTNEEVLYFQSTGSRTFFCCNLKHMTIKTLSRSSLTCYYGVPFLLEWWPTPISI